MFRAQLSTMGNVKMRCSSINVSGVLEAQVLMCAYNKTTRSLNNPLIPRLNKSR